MAVMNFGRGRRERDSLRRAVVRGEAVVLEVRLRRTSARGWGPWTPAELRLGALPDGLASWHAEDPVAVGLPTVHGAVDAAFGDVDDVWTRPVRFRTEAFWGGDSQIVVVPSERTTIELSVDPELTEPVVDRLKDLLGLSSDL